MNIPDYLVYRAEPRPVIRTFDVHSCGGRLHFTSDSMTGIAYEVCDRCPHAQPVPRHPPYAEELHIAGTPGWRGPKQTRRNGPRNGQHGRRGRNWR